MKITSSYRAYNSPSWKIAGMLLLGCLATFISVLIARSDEKTGVLVLAGIIGLGLVVYSFLNTEFGFYASIVSGFSIFMLSRLFGQDLPWGSVIEVQIMTTFFGMVVRKILARKALFEGAKHPITFAYLIYTFFLLLEVFNPEMDSIEGWAFVVRKFLQFLMIYFIALEIFKNVRDIRYFFSFWLFWAFVAALYGCYQEWFGLFDFEMNWIFSAPGRADLYSLDNGNYRKFSLLSDPAAYGIAMAVSALFALILGIGSKNRKHKMILFIASIFMFLGMAYSGTRTAFSIVPAGIVLYILMTITRRNTLVFACFCLAAFVVIIWGPIYGNTTINRIRTTFEFTETASMEVRDVNRKEIQPYIHSHPIGGGLATSGVHGLEYNPDHFLAGFPPDSGFLRTAVETGWIGLAIQCLLYFIMMYTGVAAFYGTDNPTIKLYYLGALVGAFCFIIAQYAQVSIGQIPSCFLFYPFLAVIVRLRQFSKMQLTNKT